MKLAMTFLIAVILSLNSIAEAQPYLCANRAADSAVARSGTTVGVRAGAVGRLLACFDSANVRTVASSAIAARERFIRDSVLAKIIAGQVPAPAPIPVPVPVPTPTPVPTPPPTGGAYSNRPANYNIIVNETFPFDIVSVGGCCDDTGKRAEMNMWGAEYSFGRMTVVANQDGPDSPPRALQWRYPAGGLSGEGVGDLKRSLPANTKEIYIAFSLKHSPNFEWHGISNKLLYLEPGNVILQTRYQARYMSIWNGGTVFEPWTGVLPTGVWQRVEYLLNANTKTAKIWLDGVLIVSGTVNLAGNWTEAKLNSTWGGGGSPRTRESFRWIDHLVIAVP